MPRLEKRENRWAIFILPKRAAGPAPATETKLRLKGPTTFEEGRALAGKLNAVVAEFNTKFFMSLTGTFDDVKITAKTDPPS